MYTSRECNHHCPYHLPTLVPELAPCLGWATVGSELIQYVSDLLNEVTRARIKFWKTLVHFANNSINFPASSFTLPVNGLKQIMRSIVGHSQSTSSTQKISSEDGRSETEFVTLYRSQDLKLPSRCACEKFCVSLTHLLRREIASPIAVALCSVCAQFDSLFEMFW